MVASLTAGLLDKVQELLRELGVGQGPGWIASVSIGFGGGLHAPIAAAHSPADAF